MEIIYFAFTNLLLFISIANYFTIRTPWNSDEVKDSVTVLLPARNEEKRISHCISALQAQINVPNLRVLILNDQSSDATEAIAIQQISGDQRFRIINLQDPKIGWLGKVSALQSGFENTDSEYVVTIDADVVLRSNAIASAINLLKDSSLDFTSPYPKQIAVTFSEKLIQPLLHWSWMSTVILLLAEKFPRRSTAIANGQFFVVRSQALQAIGGFESVKSKILDDVEIARSLISAGFCGIVSEGSSVAETRMYESFSEIKNGYGKSLHRAFGGVIGALIAISFIFITGILPIILIAMGSPLGWIIYASVVISRLLSDSRGQSDNFYSLFHPISSALLIYLIFYSWKNRGTIQWKGRTV
jgi:cellulose synthase/poly-beta-1,6-N-acetylglucosamine synthase-like glycosyltransferase